MTSLLHHALITTYWKPGKPFWLWQLAEANLIFVHFETPMKHWCLPGGSITIIKPFCGGNMHSTYYSYVWLQIRVKDCCDYLGGTPTLLLDDVESICLVRECRESDRNLTWTSPQPPSRMLHRAQCAKPRKQSGVETTIFYLMCVRIDKTWVLW